jgi:putative transposase
MKEHITSTASSTDAIKTEARSSMSASFERFCLAVGLEALAEMVERDAMAACGARPERDERRSAHRWGRTRGKIVAFSLACFTEWTPPG